MRKAIRIMIALSVAAMLLGGAFTGSVAAQDVQEISDNDVLDVNANIGNVNTATAVNAVNLGGDQTADATATQENFAGNTYVQDS